MFHVFMEPPPPFLKFWTTIGDPRVQTPPSPPRQWDLVRKSEENMEKYETICGKYKEICGSRI